ncbi:MAG: tRNA uracil 4-sulfurtransferase ThiI [Anaerorhabdus sp.]
MVIYDTILVRYGELSTKGRNKKDFIRQLVKNIRLALPENSSVKIESTYDRIYIRLNGNDPDPIVTKLKKVFGISSFSLTLKIPSEINEIKSCCLKLAQDEEKGTFKVVTKRNDKNFEYRSDDVNRQVASVILDETDHQVDVHHPDFKLHVEIRQEATYITSKLISGAGGYPVGINGKALVLLSGGIDSPVAAHAIMKRGVRVEAIHFASPPYTSTNAKDKVIELARIVSEYQGEMKVHIIPFTEIQMEIYKHFSESYAITGMRRMMIRTAEKLARLKRCLVLGTGESLGQVASQTLESIACINEVTQMPIIRPLITLDKLEIIDLAKKIGTYETSILPFEDCCTIFTPKNPVTKPLIEKAKEYELRFDYEQLLEKMITNTETTVVSLKEKEMYL